MLLQGNIKEIKLSSGDVTEGVRCWEYGVRVQGLSKSFLSLFSCPVLLPRL